jgi:hypothetical integral membrane protein (TIGR02206 family)
MHEALARIAATRRTSSGLVIDLTNDSFRFDFDKAALRPENREILSRIAGVLLASSGYRLFVHGHTDDVGSDEYNQQLSERRAASVASYLAGFSSRTACRSAICDVSLLLSAVALLILRPWAYEFAYYNGFGALMAVLTPDLWESFPSPSTVQFFVGHCGILIAVIFLTCTDILRPRKGGAWRTFVAVNILATIVAVLDVATGTNYLYLSAKPHTASILDYLGLDPFYLIASEGLMLLIFSLMELPFRNTWLPPS